MNIRNLKYIWLRQSLSLRYKKHSRVRAKGIGAHFSTVALLTALRLPLAVVLLATMLLTLPQLSLAQKSKRRRPSNKTIEQAQTQAQQNTQSARGISLSEINSGVSHDGKGRLWAVVIGVSNYQNLRPEEQLRFAHRDAQELAAFLRSPNGGGFPSTQIKVLINEEATIASIRTALGTWLPRSAEPDDVVYIFFAGHGVVEQGSDGYLLASDSDPQNLYATALPIAELDRIINERLRSRIAVVVADACHSGKIGLTSRGTGEQLLINRYLDEMGKSGTGNFRLLASRADERSYEDTRWGGGHGVFTHFLLEGLKGQADRDKDGIVRAGEVLDYLSQVVPEQTTALQHPRASGNIDARLPLAVVPTKSAESPSVNPTAQALLLEVRGTPGSEVYVNNSYRGRIRPEGVLLLEGLSAGNQEISVDLPGAETLKQALVLTAEKTVLDLSSALPQQAAEKSSPLVAQIKDAIAEGRVLEQGGAWTLYQQLKRDAPTDAKRADIEIAIIDELDEIGQKSINNYVRSSAAPYKREQLLQASEAYTHLSTLKPGDPQVEAKVYFSAARVMLAEGKVKQAIVLLEKSMSIDPKTACPYNALGVAYEKTNDIEKAINFYKRAVQLAPGWSLPHHRLGLQYYARGKGKDALREFEDAVKLDPSFLHARWWAAHTYCEQRRYAEAEREAKTLIRLAPGYAPAYAELARIYEASRRYELAAEAFNEYLRISSSPVAAKTESNDAMLEVQQAQGRPAQPDRK